MIKRRNSPRLTVRLSLSFYSLHPPSAAKATLTTTSWKNVKCNYVSTISTRFVTRRFTDFSARINTPFRGKIYESLRNDESLRNCDTRRVLCILTIFCRFKVKNVCIFPKFLSFQLFQSEIILVKCCKEIIVPLEFFFSEFSVFKQEYFCACVNLCI